MSIDIRRCRFQDLPTLRKISIETFQSTFEDQNTTENMEAYVNQAFHHNQLEKELSNPHSQFYFIYFHREIAGYLKININEAQSEKMGDYSLEIERLYIRNTYHRRGIGKQLLDFTYDVAKDYHKKKIWLGVWEKNDSAILFYMRCGFIQTGEHVFMMGDEKQMDFIMTKYLENE